MLVFVRHFVGSLAVGPLGVGDVREHERRAVDERGLNVCLNHRHFEERIHLRIDGGLGISAMRLNSVGSLHDRNGLEIRPTELGCGRQRYDVLVPRLDGREIASLVLDGRVGVENDDARIAVLALVRVDIVQSQHLGRRETGYAEQHRSYTLHRLLLRKEGLEGCLLKESVHRLLLTLRGNVTLPLGNIAEAVCAGLVPRNRGCDEVFLRHVEVDDVLGSHVTVDFLREGLDAARTDTAGVDFDFHEVGCRFNDSALCG